MLGAVAASALAVGESVARRLTAPPGPRTFDLSILDVEIDDGDVVVVLDRTRQTIARGSYTLLFEVGGWAQLAADVMERGPDRVARRVTKLSATRVPAIGDRVSWSGIYYTTPTEADLDAKEVRLSTSAGDAPAWLIDGDSSGAWAIHIHGMGSPRSGPLRGARVAAARGYTSLVVTYRNDGDGPWAGRRRSTLGATEVDDVAVAIRYAVDHGAQRIVLFGWSMGAAIALRLAADPTHSVHVDSLILESPVLDWIATLKANCVRAGLPAGTGLLAVPWLSLGPLARTLGLPGPIPLRTLNWIVRARELAKPTLILHGARDDSAPLEVSRTLAAIRPDLVQLDEFDAAHTMTWNSDPERWQAIVSDWLTSRHPST